MAKGKPVEPYSPDSPRSKPIVYAAVGIGIMVLASLVTVWLLANWKEVEEGFLPYRGSREFPFSARQAPPTTAKPRLQVDEIYDRENYENRENSVLESYGWVDRSRGIVRIPIERAIEVLAERGLPHRRTP